MSATNSVGTRFRRWNTTLSAWQDIGQITGITNNKTRETIDVTTLNSTGGYKEFIGSFRDGGEFQLKMLFQRDTYELMNDDFEDEDLQNYELVLPDVENSTFEFRGLVTNVGMDVSVGGAIASDCNIKVSGRILPNSGTSTGLT